MRTKIYLGVVLVFLLSLFAAAAEPAWTAQWVGPEKSATNTWTCFRKTIDLANVPATAMARIAVDSKYWLWINGKLVVFEPQVVQIEMKGEKSFQVSGKVQEEHDAGEDDIKMVMEAAGCSREEAQNMLRETGGDIAEAIIRLKGDEG